jgi:streptogramin lyase
LLIRGSLSLIFSLVGPVTAVASVKPGDIIVGNNVTNTILAIDRTTRVQSLVASGGTLCTPEGLAFDAAGQIVVASACSNEILRVNPATGAQSVVSAGGDLSYPVGLAIEASGSLIVANYTGNTIVRINPSSGAQSVLSSGGALDYPTDLAIGAGGAIFVTSQIANTIVRIDPVTGGQAVVSSGGGLLHPAAIVVEVSGALLVGNAGHNNILRVDPSTGAQSVVSSGGYNYPSGIAIDEAGHLFVANYLANSVVSVDLSTGAQSVVSLDGDLHYPTRMTVAPASLNRRTVLTFDDVPGNQLEYSQYAGFTSFGQQGWSCTGLMDDDTYRRPTWLQGYGNSYGSPSGQYAAAPCQITLVRPVYPAPNSCCVLESFDFVGAWFSSLTINDALDRNSGVSVSIRGWRAGVEVYAIDFPLTNANRDSLGYRWLQADFRAIDALTLQAFNGGFGIGGGAYLMDDFTFEAPSQGTPNAAPTASAGSNQTIRPGSVVHLDGSGSFDDNTPAARLQFAWSFLSTPAGSTATMTGADTVAPSFVPDLAGVYVVQLIVTDEDGLSSTPSQVSIGGDPPPTAYSGADQFTAVGGLVTLVGSAVDPNGDALTYSWALVGRPEGSTATIGQPASASTALVPDLPGIYVAELTASDPFGPGLPDRVEITAVTANEYSQMQVHEAASTILSLGAADVTTGGNQNALTQILSGAVLALQRGNDTQARQMLTQALVRTDGCALRGAPDGNGPGRDWVTACTAQAEIYRLLLAALTLVAP